MKKKLLFFVSWCVFIVSIQAQAQDATPNPAGRLYKAAIGLQLNNPHNSVTRNIGLTFKYFLTNRTALELNASGGYGGIYGTKIGSTLLLQRYFRVFDVTGLRWYAGAGVNLDIYNYTNTSTNQDRELATTPTLISTIGLEYKLNQLPITLSADLKLGMLGLNGKGNYNYFDKNYMRSSFSIRYTFGK